MLRALRAPGALFSCSLLLAFVVGCGVDTRRDPGGPGPGPGPGGTDAGGIVLQDSGPGFSLDAGPTTPPPPPPPGACATLAGVTPLPASCLPRCSSATLSGLSDCPDNACVTSWLEADTTPATTVMVGGEPVGVNCNLCFVWQQETCIQDACPFELRSFRECQDTGGDCSFELEWLNDCLDDSSTVEGCLSSRVLACFP